MATHTESLKFDLERVESTLFLWRDILTDNKLPRNGVVVEVAPGYEPKIGNALALLGFCGTLFVVEPDRKAIKHLKSIYKKILPRATVKMIAKPLESVVVKIDCSSGIDALLASHPFDDMVIASIVKDKNFFSQEKKDGEILSNTINGFYKRLSDDDYLKGIKCAVAVWKKTIENLAPSFFVASQYPSHTLTMKGLTQRQNSGYAVLDELKEFYKDNLKLKDYKEFGFKGNSRWWIVK